MQDLIGQAVRPEGRRELVPDTFYPWFATWHSVWQASGEVIVESKLLLVQLLVSTGAEGEEVESGADPVWKHAPDGDGGDGLQHPAMPSTT